MRSLAVPLGAFHVLTMAAAVQAGLGRRDGDWLVQCAILLALSYGLSFWIRSRAPGVTALYPFVFQVFCLTVAHYLFGSAPLLTALMIAIVVLELVAWFPLRW